MIFWEERPQTPQTKASARVISERQKLRDANAGWVIRKRGKVICSECGSRKGKDGEPAFALWSWMGKPYCTGCVPKRVLPREPIQFIPEESYNTCASCGGRYRKIGQRRRSDYCSEGCSKEARRANGRSSTNLMRGVRSADSQADIEAAIL